MKPRKMTHALSEQGKIVHFACIPARAVVAPLKRSGRLIVAPGLCRDAQIAFVIAGAKSTGAPFPTIFDRWRIPLGCGPVLTSENH
jgi:hypothetical protein